MTMLQQLTPTDREDQRVLSLDRTRRGNVDRVRVEVGQPQVAQQKTAVGVSGNAHQCNVSDVSCYWAAFARTCWAILVQTNGWARWL